MRQSVAGLKPVLALSHYVHFAFRKVDHDLLGRSRPLLAGFKLTDRCDLRCRACPFWRRAGSDMPFPRVKQVLQHLHDSGVRLLILEGGEPFLWRDGSSELDDVVAAARSLFFCTGVVTNGLRPIETLADVVWVSIDGLRGSHDYNRGPSWDRILANIEASHHPRLFANVTINRRNWREMPHLVRFLAGRVRGITVQFYYPYPSTEALMLPSAERRQVCDTLIGLKRQGLPVSDSVAALRALRDGSWRCEPWLISSVEPDGTVNVGCYLKNRADVRCDLCGFAAHTEMSLAYQGNLSAMLAGHRIFGF